MCVHNVAKFLERTTNFYHYSA